MRPMPERRAGGARGEGSFLGTVRSGGSVAAALAAEGLDGPPGFVDFYEMKLKPSGFVTNARLDKAASVYIQARRAASQSVILDRHLDLWRAIPLLLGRRDRRPTINIRGGDVGWDYPRPEPIH